MTGRQSKSLLFHVFDIQGHALAWHRSWRAARAKRSTSSPGREHARGCPRPLALATCPYAARVDRERRARLRYLAVCSDESVLGADPSCRRRVSSPSTARMTLHPRVVSRTGGSLAHRPRCRQPWHLRRPGNSQRPRRDAERHVHGAAPRRPEPRRLAPGRVGLTFPARRPRFSTPQTAAPERCTSRSRAAPHSSTGSASTYSGDSSATTAVLQSDCFTVTVK
jgi:hypothetical protein